MKKNLLLILLSTSFMYANAQNKVVGTGRPMNLSGYHNSQRTATDTLYWINTDSAPITYTAPNGGYVSGINGYEDKAKVQGFDLSASPSAGAPVTVDEVIIWFPAKQVTNPDTLNSLLKVNVYYMNGPGTAKIGGANTAVTTAPGTILSTVSIPMNDVDTGFAAADGFNLIQFDSPVWVGGNFGVGIDFSSVLAGDTLGMVSSTDGDAGQTQLAWEKFSDNTWHTMFQSWTLDVDFAIWPIIDRAPQGLNDVLLNGVSLSQNYPNPSVGLTSINYELAANSKNVQIQIIDAKGKLIAKFDEGQKVAGKYSVTVDVTNYAAGNYFYTIQADGKRMGRKMQITK
jgi:hypothetical protein